MIKTNDADGKIIAEVDIPKGEQWNIIKKSITAAPTGLKNLIVALQGDGNTELDWVSFE